MSNKTDREQCEIIYNDSSGRRCPHGEAPNVASYGCLNCGYCYGHYMTNSVYCGYHFLKDRV